MVIYDRIKKKLVEIEASLGEKPDLSQDDAIDDLDGIAQNYYTEGYANGLKFALDLIHPAPPTIYMAADLRNHLEVALYMLENHHIDCEWMAEPDKEAEESEACAEFAQQYGKSYDDLTCYDHDRMREWAKIVRIERISQYV